MPAWPEDVAPVLHRTATSGTLPGRPGEMERSLPGYLRRPRAGDCCFATRPVGNSNIHISWSTTIGERRIRLMADNRVVVYKGPGEVAVEDIEYPKLEVPEEVADAMGMTKAAPHAVILRIVSTNICGSDQHMVRGRTTAPVGQTLGHEITGEVVEKGDDVQFIDEGDICSVPFNIACGRCRNCNEGKTGVCLNVNPARAGSAYGYVDMGGWVAGQANYVMVPFADFNLLKFPDRDQALEKIRDLTMLSDIFPTGYHGCYSAGVTTGSTVYIAGAGPVGLAAAHSAQLLGAAVVIVGDLNKERLAQARSFG